ncbi:Ankyrin repeat [Amycolatopsis xylanica]|uniref:Ankyrin repeat n=1 Tax=Amycolatopsis xylanica TaxID=589385 RepID=A0A1H3CYK0_9PSEU|nr:ankyrin repeat domain-containing protein [Amycolatopsis xylanica]SDX58624.1 Ankyrin repeat [Amycolatopsis xylanica]
MQAYQPDPEYYAERALGLLESAEDGTPGAVEAFGELPRDEEGARTALARAHGFATWRDLLKHVAQVGDEPFARAYRAIEERDLERLALIVDEHPEVVDVRGTNGNDLLGMAGATCDERLSKVLLDRGADPARGNVHGWTPLHQAAYSNLPLLIDLLLDAGAPTDVSARGDGGTPLVVALFWGHREAAEKLAARSLAPGNLRVAAGLGRLDLLDAGGEHRQFYRPHSGFPRWKPTDDPSEVLNEALTWAARNDRPEALEALVARGADLEADVYRGTPLLWAAAQGKTAAVRALLELGANVNAQATFGGPGHGKDVTALHLAAQNNALDVLDVLLDAGADPTIRDGLFDSTPAGWAEHCGSPEALEKLVSVAAG